MDKVWDDLWASLCHQGDVGSASFAAVPHLVGAALDASPGILAADLIELPVAIEHSRLERPMGFPGAAHHRPPEEPDSIYQKSILELERVCGLTEKWGQDAPLRRAAQSARKLLSKRRGNILPEQDSDLGPLFR